jgi:hypothetical protein
VVRVREYAAWTMAAYAVIARIGRVDPHLTVHDIAIDPDVDDGGPDSGLPTDGPDVTVDDVHTPEPGRVSEWFRRARELWAQTTFYVFDVNSWRT